MVDSKYNVAVQHKERRETERHGSSTENVNRSTVLCMDLTTARHKTQHGKLVYVYSNTRILRNHECEQTI